ncbi:hypothetical protein [Rhodospirillum sp. A1_3_36]|uniref:hypothetical protein n=1 Tax=Rhodospirillum sp. A1_3_36 TaxID=3391666 RepID=UPI0039A4FCBA
MRRIPGTVRLTMSPWFRPLPLVGEYLASRGKRARRAYLVVQIEPGKSGFIVDAEPTSLAGLDDDARIHRFVWHSRKRKRG